MPIRGQHYDPGFVRSAERADLVAWLGTLHPIWEQRFGERHPPPPGQTQRPLLRPVYWLGSWQFACLDYYRPPHVHDRCVRAEPFPPALSALVARIEEVARQRFRGPDMPPRWTLNVCLVNFYGHHLDGDRRVDRARVGEHRDFEPGPVASVSLGAKALFQFVTPGRPGQVVGQQWLGDGSLQVFGGPLKRVLHRVQRVDRADAALPPALPDFVTRRVNLTFRYVPAGHVTRYAALPEDARHDVGPYVRRLAEHSPFWADEARVGAADPALPAGAGPP